MNLFLFFSAALVLVTEARPAILPREPWEVYGKSVPYDPYNVFVIATEHDAVHRARPNADPEFALESFLPQNEPAHVKCQFNNTWEDPPVAYFKLSNGAYVSGHDVLPEGPPPPGGFGADSRGVIYGNQLIECTVGVVYCPEKDSGCLEKQGVPGQCLRADEFTGTWSKVGNWIEETTKDIWFLPDAPDVAHGIGEAYRQYGALECETYEKYIPPTDGRPEECGEPLSTAIGARPDSLDEVTSLVGDEKTLTRAFKCW